MVWGARFASRKVADTVQEHVPSLLQPATGLNLGYLGFRVQGLVI